MEEYQGGQSVRAWVERARRAQDLVGKVDLGKVVRHDHEAVEKLSRVAAALEHLADGKDVQFVPGVDPEEAPALDPEQMRRAGLMEVLVSEGLGDRLGRVFVTDDESAAKRPLDLVPHREGLPEFLLCVAPDHGPVEGAHGIFISERGVFAAMIPQPVIRHRWRITRSRPYDDEREMIASVHHFLSRDAD